MKRTAKLQIVITIAMLMLLTASAACGAVDPVRNITYTPHNLSTSGPVGTFKSNVQELCVFCHTPHNANINRALWNHNMQESGLVYHMYTTGADLTSVTKQVTAPKLESLMCLSCHDGRTAVNVVHRTKMASNVTQITVGGKTMYQLHINGFPTDGMGDALPDPDGFRMGSFGPDPIMQIDAPANLGAYRSYMPDGSFAGSTDGYKGTEFGDDHPISMSYDNVLAERKSKYPSNPGLIDPVANPTRLELIKFYGTNRRVECGSCHDPHVAYNFGGNGVGSSDHAPFLRKTNVGSELCLSCHDK